MKHIFRAGKKSTTLGMRVSDIRARVSRFTSAPIRRLSKKGLKRIGFSVAGEGKISLRWLGRNAIVSVGGNARRISHVFVLEGKPKRLILVDKAVTEPGGNGLMLRISGSSMLPGDFASGKNKPLIYSLSYIKPEKRVAFFDNLEWVQFHPSDRVESGASEPVDFIHGKGLGLFVDRIVKDECSSLGVKKVFGLVENKDYGAAANFRPVTAKERSLAETLFPTVREFLRSGDSVGRLMVSDIKPKH